MRIALLGAAASALVGGTLAVTPLTSVSTPIQASGACGGAKCERVASVLMPETPKPSGDLVSPAPTPFTPAANVTPPEPATPGGPSAGVAAGPSFV